MMERKSMGNYSFYLYNIIVVMLQNFELMAILKYEILG